MGKVQLDSLWMLGLALAPSKPSHSALTEVFVEALGELRDMEHPVRPTVIVMTVSSVSLPETKECI